MPREIVCSDTIKTLEDAQRRGDEIIDAALPEYQRKAGDGVTVKRDDFFRDEKPTSNGKFRVTVFYEPSK